MSPPGAVDELGRLPSLVYNRSRSWGSLDAELRQGQWKPPRLITQHALDLVEIKFRGSHEHGSGNSAPALTTRMADYAIDRVLRNRTHGRRARGAPALHALGICAVSPLYHSACAKIADSSLWCSAS